MANDHERYDEAVLLLLILTRTGYGQNELQDDSK